MATFPFVEFAPLSEDKWHRMKIVPNINNSTSVHFYKARREVSSPTISTSFVSPDSARAVNCSCWEVLHFKIGAENACFKATL